MSKSTILRHFKYRDQSSYKHEVGALFYSMADELDATLPSCAEKTVGLRKLLEARDSFFRALDEANGR